MRKSAVVKVVSILLLGVVGSGIGVMMLRRENRLLQERMGRLTQADVPIKRPEGFAESKAMVAAIARADSVTLSEGLPHPMWAKQLLAMELATKPTVQVHGFPFYQEPLKLSDEDTRQLIELFRRADLFQEAMVGKMCGGFHPDYRLAFHVGQDLYEVLICFGCHEAMLYGPEADSYCDIQEQAYRRFERILKGYHKNRPID